MRATPPDQWRYTKDGDSMASAPTDGMNGIFIVPIHTILNSGHKIAAFCIVSDGTGIDLEEVVPWEHVSVRMMEFGKSRLPNWSEMCAIKEIFWEDDEVVVQYHPAKKDYINFHPHVLHLWRNKKERFPTPPKICV